MSEEETHDIETVINYRIRIYNTLSNDALKILNIQLFVLPLVFSAVSLINQLLKSDSDSGAVGIADQLKSGFNVVAVYDGLIFLISGIILTTIVYYHARKMSTKQPEYLVDDHREDFTPENFIESIFSKYFEKEKKHGTNPPEKDDILQSFEKITPLGTPHRLALFFSLLASFYSVYRVGNELFSVVFPRIDQIINSLIGFIAIVIIISLAYYPIISAFEKFGESLYRIGKTLLVVFVDFINKSVEIVLNSIWTQLTEGDIVTNTKWSISILLLLFGSSKYPVGYISTFHLASLIFGEMLAISNICYYFLPDPR